MNNTPLTDDQLLEALSPQWQTEILEQRPQQPALVLNQLNFAVGDAELVDEIRARRREDETVSDQVARELREEIFPPLTPAPTRHLLAEELQQIRDLVGEENLEWMAKEILTGGTYIDNQVDWIAIREDTIDDVLQEDLSSEPYLLGSFNANCIAEATGWPLFLIELAKECEHYEKIGNEMTEAHVHKLVELYVQSDGYGNHFARYDGNEHLRGFNHTIGNFYFFRVE
jgi:hypothetical protein